MTERWTTHFVFVIRHNVQREHIHSGLRFLLYIYYYYCCYYTQPVSVICKEQTHEPRGTDYLFTNKILCVWRLLAKIHSFVIRCVSFSRSPTHLFRVFMRSFALFALICASLFVNSIAKSALFESMQRQKHTHTLHASMFSSEKFQHTNIDIE